MVKMIAYIKNIESNLSHVNGIDTSILDQDIVSVFVNDSGCDSVVNRLENEGYEVETFYSESFIPIIYYSGSYYDYMDVDKLLCSLDNI